MTDKNGLIDNQEEYDKELKWFSNEISYLSKVSALRNTPDTYRKFMAVLDRAEKIGLFTKDYCNLQRKKIIDGMNNANLKEQIKKKLGWGK